MCSVVVGGGGLTKLVHFFVSLKSALFFEVSLKAFFALTSAAFNHTAGLERRDSGKDRLELFTAALRVLEAPHLQAYAQFALPAANNSHPPAAARTITAARVIAGMQDGRLLRLHHLVTEVVSEAGHNRCEA